MIKEIAFTGSAVTDMKRARAFYEEILGLAPREELAGRPLRASRRRAWLRWRR